ncbi:MAG: transposase [Chloroflexi bacterium]|nr:transposase [Chloroflexota bacterium]
MELTNSQWALIRLLLPEEKRTGRPRAHDRRTLNGILHVQRAECRWRDMPRKYGSPVTCWRRFTQLKSDGAWGRIWQMYLTFSDEQAHRQAA